jgi:hypothetical protein
MLQIVLESRKIIGTTVRLRAWNLGKSKCSKETSLYTGEPIRDSKKSRGRRVLLIHQEEKKN